MKNEIQTSIQSNSRTRKKIFFLYRNKNISFLIGLILLFSFYFVSKEEDNLINTINSYSKINLIIQGIGFSQIFNKNCLTNIIDVIGTENKCVKNCFFENDINNVTIIFEGIGSICSQMFYNSINITEIDLSNCDISNVYNIDSMFYGCSKLKSVKLNNLNTLQVISMNYFFYGCESLKSIDISELDTSNVLYMNSMFEGCKNLTSIDLSNFDIKF